MHTPRAYFVAALFCIDAIRPSDAFEIPTNGWEFHFDVNRHISGVGLGSLDANAIVCSALLGHYEFNDDDGNGVEPTLTMESWIPPPANFERAKHMIVRDKYVCDQTILLIWVPTPGADVMSDVPPRSTELDKTVRRYSRLSSAPTVVYPMV